MEGINRLLKQAVPTTALSVCENLTCEFCGESRTMNIRILGQERRVLKLCSCRVQKRKQEALEEENREKQKKLEQLMKFSMMDDHFSRCTFENFECDDHNISAYEKARKYCNEWSTVCSSCLGLLIFGPVGTGKTYLSFAIGNELLSRGIPVIAMSSTGVLNKIRRTYQNKEGEGEMELLRAIDHAALLIIDDLGAETGSEWAKEKLYEIIDNRWRSRKPLIVTTNLSLKGLEKRMKSQDGVDRTYDRIVEMCMPLEMGGTSKRLNNGHKKFQALLKLIGR